MNWNRDQSVKLSKFCVTLFMALLIIVCVSAPWFFREFVSIRGEAPEKLPLFLCSVYTTAVPAACALIGMRRLLHNISEGNVFIEENVAVLRRLSWYCAAAAVIFFASMFYYLPFLVISAAAAFMGLILRVVKNVFAEAVSIKTENDYTI